MEFNMADEIVKEDVICKQKLIRNFIINNVKDHTSLFEIETWGLALGLNVLDIYTRLYVFSPANVDLLADRIDQDIKNLLNLKKYITTCKRGGSE